MDLPTFFARSWQEYARITPDASRIHSLLETRGERVINDHIAIRTFNLTGINRRELGRYFESHDYRLQPEEFLFPQKKVRANFWLHPNPDLPKIFISELMVEEFGSELRTWVEGLAAQASKKFSAFTPELFFELGWEPVSFEDYEKFYRVSEYAAWTAAFGMRVNHFTVFVNALKSFSGIDQLNHFLIESGFVLNEAGGLVKGAPGQGLEQSSTKARKIRWKFGKGETREIMSCYYEFARRYPLPGHSALFQGFIPESADKIFESTFEKDK